MVVDQETNTVFFSDLIRQYPSFGSVEKLLQKHGVDYRFLSATKDIWCRDYMPIQVAWERFVQFCYEPSYLHEYLHLQSDPDKVLRGNGIEARRSDINLDGGNLVRWKDKVMMTTRVFKENPAIKPEYLTAQLESLLEAQVLFIPDIKTDMTGHADGHLRFIDEKTVLVNALDTEYNYWRDGFLKMVKAANLHYVEMPRFEYSDKKHPNTAIGIYVNYLEIGNLILFPIFETIGNKDAEALEVIRKVFPERIIEPININDITNRGGLLNCVSWGILNSKKFSLIFGTKYNFSRPQLSYLKLLTSGNTFS